MSAPVSWSQILDGMVEKLRPIFRSASPPVGAYLRQLDWYAGEFASREALGSSGISDRCPAVLVDLISERVIRTMAGGRIQFVESTMGAVCAADSMRSLQDRQSSALDRVLYDVRARLHGERLGLSIQPLHYAGLGLVAKEPGLFAYVARFTVRHHTDLSASSSGLARLERFDGAVHQVGGSASAPLVTDLPEDP